MARLMRWGLFRASMLRCAALVQAWATLSSAAPGAHRRALSGRLEDVRPDAGSEAALPLPQPPRMPRWVPATDALTAVQQQFLMPLQFVLAQ